MICISPKCIGLHFAVSLLSSVLLVHLSLSNTPFSNCLQILSVSRSSSFAFYEFGFLTSLFAIVIFCWKFLLVLCSITLFRKALLCRSSLVFLLDHDRTIFFCFPAILFYVFNHNQFWSSYVKHSSHYKYDLTVYLSSLAISIIFYLIFTFINFFVLWSFLFISFIFYKLCYRMWVS